MKQNRGSVLVWVIVVVALIIVGGGAYYFGTHETPVLPITQNTPSISTSASTAGSNNTTVNWKTYSNDVHGFSFMYPYDWNVNTNYPENASRGVAPSNIDGKIVNSNSASFVWFNTTNNFTEKDCVVTDIGILQSCPNPDVLVKGGTYVAKLKNGYLIFELTHYADRGGNEMPMDVYKTILSSLKITK